MFQTSDLPTSQSHPATVSKHHRTSAHCQVAGSSDLPRSPDLRKAMGDPITKKKKGMCDLRGRIQAQMDSFNVSWSSIG